jgi:hypothetical protein
MDRVGESKLYQFKQTSPRYDWDSQIEVRCNTEEIKIISSVLVKSVSQCQSPK